MKRSKIILGTKLTPLFRMKVLNLDNLDGAKSEISTISIRAPEHRISFTLFILITDFSHGIFNTTMLAPAYRHCRDFTLATEGFRWR